jgi:hypothetical protein
MLKAFEAQDTVGTPGLMDSKAFLAVRMGVDQSTAWPLASPRPAHSLPVQVLLRSQLKSPRLGDGFSHD